MKLEPLADRVIVRAMKEEEMTASGIVLPQMAQEKPQRGIVVAVGPGSYHDGMLHPVGVLEEDEILYSKYGGTEIEVDGETLLVLKEQDVLARVLEA